MLKVSLVFTSSYGLNVMLLSFSVSGSTAAVHTGDTGLNLTCNKFYHSIIFNAHYNSESDKH